jgi:hypothetical protein
MKNDQKLPLKEQHDEMEEVVNWPVVLPILLILLAAIVYAFIF